MKKLVFFCFLSFLFSRLAAQTAYFIDLDFDWLEQGALFNEGDDLKKRPYFSGAFFPEERPLYPVHIEEIPLSGAGALNVNIESITYQDINIDTDPASTLAASPNILTSVEKDRGRYYGKLVITPLVKEGNRIRAISRIRLSVRQSRPLNISARSVIFAEQSELRSGQIFKMAVREAGIYKLDYNFLKDDLKVDIDNVDPRNIKILTNLGGGAPEIPNAFPVDDLKEIPVFISGEEDGNFNQNDFIIFYTEGPDRWFFNTEDRYFEMEKNVYDDEHFVYLKVDNSAGNRIRKQANLSSAVIEFDEFDDYQAVEDEKVNLHHYWGETQGKAQGSSRIWFGDHFKNLRNYNYSDRFDFPNLINSEDIFVSARMALRAEQRSTFLVKVGNQSQISDRANAVAALSGVNDNISNYANAAHFRGNFSVGSEGIQIDVAYPFPSSSNDGSEAWLDYIQINAKRDLQMTGRQMAFRNKASSNFDQVAYSISGANTDLVLWNITNPLQPVQQEYEANGNELLMRTDNSARQLQEFIAFYPAQLSLKPSAIGEIGNQNLHGLRDVDMLILTNEELLEAAQELAAHRNAVSGLNVEVVDIAQVFNEFASGRKEPAAIRDFARMLYTRDTDFRYLLLFGDGSFDHKDIYGLGKNVIPTFQQESFNPLYAFPADDYFGILEEGANNPLVGRLNISVGRIPVNTPLEAQQAVNKIKAYDNNPKSLEDWRNRLVFVADDEDSNVHLNDADDIAEELGERFREFNLDKIYLDAFPQVSTPGGNRFPEVTAALNQAIFKGSLIVTYLGHGGEQGWAQERILNISDILNWNNFDRMPLLMTATCSFTGYDDPSFTSAGEESFLNPRGGAFALMTTTRAVFANQNARLTELALEQLFTKTNGVLPTLGEAMQRAKNISTGNSTVTNSRKFTLIGDPSQYLANPEYGVRTLTIDNEDINDGSLDTLSALQRVKVSGEIVDANGQRLEDFNGIIFPTVFDKKLSLSTLGQDRGSNVRSYALQKNVIFKGRASVVNGQFEFRFIIPKDINYAFGFGKISYYASDLNQKKDANGQYGQIIIGGSNAASIDDDTGPKIDVFMNTEDFVFGGLTDPNPTLLVKLEDDYGINVVGNSIGHDLEGILDDDTQNTFLLNDFFQSELDDFTKGEVRFPLEGLSEGLHNLRVKAWDVANNSSEGYTEFLVANSEGFILDHVLNYPNPFTDRTCFQFDHNFANQELDVSIQIFTVSGRLVKTLHANIFSDGAIRQDDCIEWDGKDDFGDPLARGVYLYKVKVRTNIPGSDSISGQSEFQKLVLLK